MKVAEGHINAQVVLLCLMAALAPVRAQSEGSGTMKDPSRDTRKLMARMLELVKPSSRHLRLQQLEGEWEALVRARTAPATGWRESEQTTVVRSILGGRFIQFENQGEAASWTPEPYSGVQILGYDNQEAEFVAVWLDNRGTSIFLARGREEGDVRIAFEGSWENPMTEQTEPFRWVYRIEEADRFLVEIYRQAPGGDEFMASLIEFFRK